METTKFKSVYVRRLHIWLNFEIIRWSVSGDFAVDLQNKNKISSRHELESYWF